MIQKIRQILATQDFPDKYSVSHYQKAEIIWFLFSLVPCCLQGEGYKQCFWKLVIIYNSFSLLVEIRHLAHPVFWQTFNSFRSKEHHRKIYTHAQSINIYIHIYIYIYTHKHTHTHTHIYIYIYNARQTVNPLVCPVGWAVEYTDCFYAEG